MLYEIKYEYNDFEEWKNTKGKDDINPIELYDMKFLRYQHLIRFFNKLGFIEANTLNINKEFTGDDLKRFIIDYKEIEAKTLNSMMNDNYIKITKKDDKIKELNTKQIKGIFNNLLKDEFGLEVVGCGTKQRKIEGKMKKLTMMKLRNYCPPINTKKDDEETQKYKKDFEIKFGSDKYNRFNVYKENFNEVIERGDLFNEEGEYLDDESSDDESSDEEKDTIEEIEEIPIIKINSDEGIEIEKDSNKIYCIGCGIERKNAYTIKCMRCLMKDF